MRVKTIAPVLAALCLAAPVPSLAEPLWKETTDVTVSYLGLDLSKPEGAAVLLSRIQRAATRACGGYPDWPPLQYRQMGRFRACRDKAIADAVARLDQPRVTELHNDGLTAKDRRMAAY